MEGNGDVARNVFTVEELQEAGSVDVGECGECTSQPLHWIIGTKTMAIDKPGSHRESVDAKRFRSMSGVMPSNREPCLKLVEISPLRKPLSKMQPGTKAGPKRKPTGMKMPKKGKTPSSRAPPRRRDVNGKLKLRKVPLYLRNLDDYSDPAMKSRIAKAKHSKDFRDNKDKKIEELTMENEKLRIEIKQSRMKKLNTDKQLKKLAEESYNLKTEFRCVKQKMEMIQTRMSIFVRNAYNILTANGMIVTD